MFHKRRERQQALGVSPCIRLPTESQTTFLSERLRLLGDSRSDLERAEATEGREAGAEATEPWRRGTRVSGPESFLGTGLPILRLLTIWHSIFQRFL